MTGCLEGKSILVVDDDPTFSETASHILQRAGAEVAVAVDGADALFQLETRAYDLAVVDLIMPKVDGLRMISTVRHTPKLASLPVVVVTSRRDVNAKEDAHRLDVALFLTKPLAWSRFAGQIADILGGDRADCETMLKIA